MQHKTDFPTTRPRDPPAGNGANDGNDDTSHAPRPTRPGIADAVRGGYTPLILMKTLTLKLVCNTNFDRKVSFTLICNTKTDFPLPHLRYTNIWKKLVFLEGFTLNRSLWSCWTFPNSDFLLNLPHVGFRDKFRRNFHMVLHGFVSASPKIILKRSKGQLSHEIQMLIQKVPKQLVSHISYDPLCGAGLLAWPWTLAAAIWRICLSGDMGLPMIFSLR